MEPKALFDKALSEVSEKYTFSPDREIVNNIMERAKSMEKHKQNRHRVLTAAAGTAAAFAVIGGSVLGLNYLNEHGGLKEGGSAAYHEDSSTAPEDPSAVTTQTDLELTDNIADNLDNMGVENHLYNKTDETEAALPQGLKFEFDGFTVEPRWCTFDGMTLHMAYDVISDGTLPEDVDTLVSLYAGPYYCTHTSNESNRSGNRALIYATICCARMRTELSVSFVEPKYFEDDMLDMLPGKTAETAFTVTRPDTAHAFSADTGLAKVKLTYAEDIVNVEHVDATYNAVSFKLKQTELRNIPLLYGFEPVIRLTDGTEIKPFSGQVPFEFEADDGLYIRYMVDTFDPAMIEEIYVNGVPLCNMEGTPDMEDEAKDIMDAAGDVIEFDGLTAAIEKVDFDGTFLRVYYTPSGYEGDSPLSMSAIMTLMASDPSANSEKIFGGKGGVHDPQTELNCTTMFVDLDEGETVDICFTDTSGEEAGHYVLTGIDKSQNTCAYDINDNGISWIRLSPFGAVIAGPEEFTRDPKCSFSVIYKDGSSRRIYGDSSSGGTAGGSHGTPIEEHFGLASGDIVTTFMTLSPDPIDAANIVAVEINRTDVALPVYVRTDFIESSENIGQNLLTDADAHAMPDDTVTGDEAVGKLMEYAGGDWHYPVNENYTAITYYPSWDRFNLSALSDTREGDPIFAATGGTVVEINKNVIPGNDPGKYITVQAADGRKWQYSHCSEIYADVGDTVAAGDRIAAIGATGWCTGPCLAIDFPES